MKHKLINYGKKTKKLWVSAIVVLFVVAVAYSQIVKAQHGTDKVSSGTTYPKNGYWTGVSINGPWGTSTIYFTVTTDKTYSGNTFNDKSRPLYINVKQTNDNPYGMKILDTSPSTNRNASGNYSWFNLKIGYWAPAHYYYSGNYFDTPSATSAAHQVSNTAGHSKENHWVETTIRMSAYDTAVATYYDTSAKKYYRYHDCHATIYLWGRNQYKVYYNGNGGDISESERTFNDGDNFTFPTVSRRGYTFDKWIDQGTGWESSTDWLVCSGNYTEIAQWIANQYNVSFDDNGADSGNVSDSTATYDSNFTLPQNGYKKKGYKFLGWSTDENATSPQYTAGQTFTYQTDGDTVFYAVWAKSDFEVKFHGNGSSAADYTADLTYNKSVSLPKNVFERPGYTFIGWAQKEDGDKEVPEEVKYTDGQAVKDLCEPGETCHLYAIWKKSDGSFETKNIIHDDKMFLGDVNLTGQNGTGYSNANIDSKSAHIDKEDDPGYFTDRYGSNNN